MAAPGGPPAPTLRSPFADDDQAPLLHVGGVTVVAAEPAAAQLGWEDAYEECSEVPAIATQLSAALSSYSLSHRQRSCLAAEEVASLKADDSRCGAAGWRAETHKLLALALPIAVSAA